MFCVRKINEKNSRASWLVGKENVTEQKETLIERYLFLYQNSPLILAYILSQGINSSVSKTITKRCGITIDGFKNKNDIKVDKNNNIDILELLEDFLLGDGTYPEYLLSSFCKELNRQDIFLSVKNDFDLEKGNIGIGKFDSCMKTILDIVHSFISSQEDKKTDVYIAAYNGLYAKNEKIIKEDISDKLEALDRYYDILAYRNTKENNFKFDDNDKGLGINLNVSRSLVNHSLFIGAFCSQRSIGSWWHNRYYLDEDKKRDIYFDLHDELPWNLSVKCLINGNGCRMSFSLVEEDIIFHKNDYKCICPCCGNLLSVYIPKFSRKEKIMSRIKQRFKNDEDLNRKLAIISELSSIGGLDIVKQKVKK